MKQTIYLSIILFVILGCKNDADKSQLKSTNRTVHLTHSSKASNDSLEVDPSKIECVPYAYAYNYPDNFSPGTFGKITYVYNSAKQGRKIIDSLPFNTSLNILKEYSNYFLVCTPKAKSGYVKKTDLYFHSVFWGLKSNTYLVGISKYPSKQATENAFPTCDASELKIIKIDESKKVVNVYEDSIMGTHYDLKLIHNSALKNAEAVLYLNYHCYNELGVVADHFIVDNGKNISRLFVADGGGDGGMSQECNIYLPVNLTNGKKIVLARNGILAINEITGKPDIFPYPADCGVPIDELIVVQNTETEDIENKEEGGLAYNKDGTMAQKISIIETMYYRWNGKVLQKVKTIAGQ